MSCNSCGRLYGVKKCSHLFFYLFVALCVLAVSVCLLCACNEDDNSSPQEIVVESVTFVLNNGEDDIICTMNNDIPSPTKDGHYLAGWFSDENFENEMSFDSVSALLNNINSNNPTSNEFKVYAKWETLKDMKNIRVSMSSFIYDGSVKYPTLENVPDGAKVDYISDDDCINAGTYPIVAVIEKYGYNTYRLSCTLTIKKARIDISDIAFDDKSVVWSGNVNSIFISGELPKGVSVSYENNGQTDVGEYEVKAHFNVGSNYEAIEDMTAILTVQAKTYEITFVEENGDSRTMIVAHGADLNEYTTPAQKRGYVGTWIAIDFDSINESATVYAEYKLEKYNISYVSDDGTAYSDLANTYTMNDSITLPDISTDYYTFEGWYDNADYEGSVVAIIPENTVGHKTFYAKWIPIQYSVNFNLDGGVNNSENINHENRYIYNVLSKNLTLNDPIKKGYEFVCWETEDGVLITEISSENPSDMTICAKWKAAVYSVEYDLNGGDTAEELIESFTVEDDGIILPIPFKRGYTFCGWYDNFEFGGNEITKINTNDENEDIHLYAKWEITVYGIDYTLNGGAFNTKVIDSFTLNDSEFTLPNPNRTGYSFEGWFESVNLDGERLLTINPDTNLNDISLYAKWLPIEYTISYVLNGGVNNSANPSSYTIENENITLASPTRQSYEFKGWFSTEDFTGSEVKIILTHTRDTIVLYAKWEYIVPKYTLESINGKNIITAYNYNLGADVVIPNEIDGVVVDGVAKGVFQQAESVIIEACWTEIDAELFEECSKLQTLVLPDTLNSLHAGMLADCIELKNLTVPFVGLSKYTDKDGNYYPLSCLFGDEDNSEGECCYSVTAQKVVVREGNSSINQEENEMRYVPHTLKNVTVLGGNVIDYGLSGLVSVVNITFEGDVCSLGVCAMRGCVNLKKLTLSQSTASIAPSAIMECSSLEAVNAYSATSEDIIVTALRRIFSEDVAREKIFWIEE